MIETGREVVCIKTHELSNGDIMFSDMVAVVKSCDDNYTYLRLAGNGNYIETRYTSDSFGEYWVQIP